MNKHIREIVRHSAVYAAGSVLARLASFLLLPFYTSHLAPDAYGAMAVLDTTTSLIGILIGANIGASLIRYHHAESTEDGQSRVWWTGMSLVVGVVLVVLVPVFCLRDVSARILLGTGATQGGFWLGLILPALGMNVLGQTAYAYLRVRKWSGIFVGLSLFRLLLNVALNVYFIAVLQMGLTGLLLGNLLSAGVDACIVLSVMIAACGRCTISTQLARKVCKYSWPMIVSGLLAVLLQQADRYMIRPLAGLEQVGIYEVAAKLAAIPSMLFLMPFGAIWSAKVFEIARLPDRGRIYARVFELSSYGLLLITLLVAFSGKWALRIMVAPEYAEAASVIPILLASLFVLSLLPHFNLPLKLVARNHLQLPAFVLGVIVNVAANFVLIPRWGIRGAAWATLVAVLSVAIPCYLVGRRVERIP